MRGADFAEAAAAPLGDVNGGGAGTAVVSPCILSLHVLVQSAWGTLLHSVCTNLASTQLVAGMDTQQHARAAHAWQGAPSGGRLALRQRVGHARGKEEVVAPWQGHGQFVGSAQADAWCGGAGGDVGHREGGGAAGLNACKVGGGGLLRAEGSCR